MKFHQSVNLGNGLVTARWREWKKKKSLLYVVIVNSKHDQHKNFTLLSRDMAILTRMILYIGQFFALLLSANQPVKLHLATEHTDNFICSAHSLISYSVRFSPKSNFYVFEINITYMIISWYIIVFYMHVLVRNNIRSNLVFKGLNFFG